eukprot:CAMPEP_0195537262 /NCGR_PEP_ID=MMETSP0794_2-20130614/47607_1 /TAXON_ID=515487 /ORGANISM="Stephanopyxis turris, Strain CCMP 815" /LENGTH=177 /DNA_ID=CAMNT_0040670929 /DNA_START=133 /DNA_END=663 /DNA_ORIENTATION=-
MYSFLANLEIPTEVMFGIQEGDGEDDEQDEEHDVEDPESKNRGGGKNKKRVSVTGKRRLQIFLGGDSAGGTLAIAVVQKAKAHGLREPESMVLVSPWVDMEEDEVNTKPDGSFSRNQQVDFLPPPCVSIYANAYAGEQCLHKLSPINFDLRGFPPMLVLTGEFEMLHDQHKAFVRRA